MWPLCKTFKYTSPIRKFQVALQYFSKNFEINHLILNVKKKKFEYTHIQENFKIFPKTLC